VGVSDEELAAEVRRCAEAFNKAIKAAADAGIFCSMRFGQPGNARSTSVIIAGEHAPDAAILIDLSKVL
jgi:hypothetical protein